MGHALRFGHLECKPLHPLYPTKTKEYFVLVATKDALNINLLWGVADPGATIYTDDEGAPYGPYDSLEEVLAQIKLLQWGTDIARPEGPTT